MSDTAIEALRYSEFPNSSDCISRQAAIDAVLDRMNVEKHGRDAKPEEIQWTLEKLPSVQPEKRTEERTETHSCDLIDRQAAIDAIESAFDRETILNRFVRKIAISAVRLLPSAQPEQKTGHWINSYKRQTCSICKQRGYRSWNFCPNCGADMRGENNDRE